MPAALVGLQTYAALAVSRTFAAPAVVALVALFTALGALAAAPAVVVAQAGDSPEALAGTAARAWGSGDIRALQSLLASEGITLRVDEQAHTGVNARQARASLERFIGRHEPGEVGIRRATALGGDPPRGLVELDWRTTLRDAPEPVSYVIFLGLTLADDRWRVVEIRILP
jgi:hypothetical protein